MNPVFVFDLCWFCQNESSSWAIKTSQKNFTFAEAFLLINIVIYHSFLIVQLFIRAIQDMYFLLAGPIVLRPDHGEILVQNLPESILDVYKRGELKTLKNFTYDVIKFVEPHLTAAIQN